MDHNESLFVTKPLTPDQHEFFKLVKKILDSGRLTNGSDTVKQFEDNLCEFLGIEFVSVVSSGTLALTIALKALALKGEVITSPFTHIGTINAIIWNGLKPVFVDILEDDFTIDPKQIKKAITKETSAILPVHVFGRKCNTHQIEELADKNHLKTLYDGAHCFGVKEGNQSILKIGDLSVVSFHATKVFNCIEGGAIISKSQSDKEYLDCLINNGIAANSEIEGTGLNAKLNEIQAAYGLVLLKKVADAIALRKKATETYVRLLKDIPGIRLVSEPSNYETNYSYMPVIINSDIHGRSVDRIMNSFFDKNIFPKRYFYPLACHNKFYKQYITNNLETANKIASNIICLPLSHSITENQINKVVDVLKT